MKNAYVMVFVVLSLAACTEEETKSAQPAGGSTGAAGGAGSGAAGGGSAATTVESTCKQLCAFKVPITCPTPRPAPKATCESDCVKTFGEQLAGKSQCEPLVLGFNQCLLQTSPGEWACNPEGEAELNESSCLSEAQSAEDCLSR